MVLRLRNPELVNDSAGHQFSLSLVGIGLISSRLNNLIWLVHAFVCGQLVGQLRVSWSNMAPLRQLLSDPCHFLPSRRLTRNCSCGGGRTLRHQEEMCRAYIEAQFSDCTCSCLIVWPKQVERSAQMQGIVKWTVLLDIKDAKNYGHFCNQTRETDSWNSLKVESKQLVAAGERRKILTLKLHWLEVHE